MKMEIPVRFRSFVDPLYRDTTVSRYLSYKSLKAYATIPNGFMGKSNLPLLGFNAIERDSMSTHVHGFSFLPAKTVSFDQTKANNRCPYNLSVL